MELSYIIIFLIVFIVGGLLAYRSIGRHYRQLDQLDQDDEDKNK